MGSDDPLPSKADEYRHADGTIEVVFAVEDDAVLTVREYPSSTAFARGVEGATYVGRHEGVADLPGVDAFREDPTEAADTDTEDGGADDRSTD